MSYRLTEFSHGAGCGCKLSPGVLQNILGESTNTPSFDHLLVGNDTKDDAAVVNLDGKTAIVSTTDFFMPIVDDAFDFGAIAATNAISDIYAMAAKPLMAIAILGWPIEKIPAAEANRVLTGARSVCTRAGIPLAGGHSIDSPEPIFGLAVTGQIAVSQIKRNADGQLGDSIYLTKPLGIGIVTTAQKRKLASEVDLELAKRSMLQLNDVGSILAQLDYVHAVTDVTGFGLAGHLLEVCEAANLAAQINFNRIPTFDFVDKYLALDCVPGGTNRNWQTYGHKISLPRPDDYKIMADPQTSGGLLITVDDTKTAPFEKLLDQHEIKRAKIGKLVASQSPVIIVS